VSEGRNRSFDGLGGAMSLLQTACDPRRRPWIGHCPCGWKRLENRSRDFRASTIFQASHGGRTIKWPAWLLFGDMVINLQHVAAAHDLFAAYIQHHILLTVGTRYSDVEVDLTFFESSLSANVLR
jgi:hypothetical protein